MSKMVMQETILSPKKLAILATAGNIKRIDSIRAAADEKHNAQIAQYKESAAKIATITASFNRKADENGRLFGSVSENDLAQYLIEKGVKVHRSNIIIEETLKQLGEHTVKVSFAQDIDVDLKVIIEKE